jgi:hypothetical protein
MSWNFRPGSHERAKDARSDSRATLRRILPFALAGAALAGLIGLATLAGLILALLRSSPPSDAPELAAPPAADVATPSGALAVPPPFDERDLPLPEPDASPASEVAAYCDPQNWRGVTMVLGRSGDAFRVDEVAWRETHASGRAGLAAWMSQCQQDGGPITIVADGSGEPLARYEPRTGLQLVP